MWGSLSWLCGPVGSERGKPQGSLKQTLSTETLGLIKVLQSRWDKKTNPKPRSITEAVAFTHVAGQVQRFEICRVHLGVGRGMAMGGSW